MPSEPPRVSRLNLTLPVIATILSFTAIPSGLRPLNLAWLLNALEPRFGVLDIVANTIGYIPLGVVLSRRGVWQSLGLGAAISVFAEITQIFSVGRFPSLIDVATNVLGTAIGVGLCRVWPTVVEAAVDVNRRTAAAAMGLAVIVGLGAHVSQRDVEDAVSRMTRSVPDVNLRGSTTPGRLEAFWTFDRVRSTSVVDESENGLAARIVNQVSFAPGVDGSALALNGVDQFLHIGEPVALRLTGSLTISAWIKAKSFARRDVAIVSSRARSGFQLEATEISGTRAVGFRLSNVADQLMARFGKTQLMTNRWYHVAGVYDAPHRKLDVYLNGRLDNGCLLGRVTPEQRVSSTSAFIGRRSGRRGFEFAGLIDNVRIYSLALSESEIQQQFESDVMAAAPLKPLDVDDEGSGIEGPDVPCVSDEQSDARFFGIFLTLGMLIAVGSIGVWPTRHRVASIALSFVAGLIVLPSVVPLIPPSLIWLLPVFATAGAAVVGVSIRS